MVSRPELYWTVRKEAFGGNFGVMRVTSVRMRQIYGSIDGMPTHCRHSATFGKFDTESDAQAAVKRIRDVWNSHNDDIKQAERALSYVYAKRKNETDALLNRIARGEV